MSNHTPNTVGIDISKAHLDAHEWPSHRAARFANDAAGIQRLAEWIGAPVQCVIYESTGPWHRALEDALADTLPLACVNALRARRFAQAMGQQAKTDAVDARVLAAMGAAIPPRQVTPRSATRRDLDELQTAREALIKDRTAALNRQKHARHPLLKRQLKNRLAQNRRQLQTLDEAIATLIGADETLARQAEVLVSIPGIASVTAAGLLAEMPELGRIDAKAAASLAGLAPVTRESGQYKGRGCIRGGRARLRKILYMAAVSASRHNPDLARKYADLRARGKPPKVALTAIMRKLLVLANALLKQDRTWAPNHAAAIA